MARSAATAVENSFVKGLITEASGMNFPENACTETYDCIFNLTGSVKRREGFQPESDYVYQTVTDDINSVNEYTWNNVANLSGVSFVVQQVGMTLYFFSLSGAQSLSGGKKSSTVSLSTYLQAGAPSTSDGSVCQFTEGDGKLIVTHPYCTPFYVEYDPDADTLSSTAITINIRDFTRLDDSLDIDERPSSLGNVHRYNLYNQGWYITAATDDDHNGESVLDYWDNNRSDYPSNADIWWLFKDTDERMNKSEVPKVNRGNSPAPNGHYLLDPFNTGRQTLTSISGLDEDSSGYQRPSCVAFYTGRAFYGGVQVADYGDTIYFTQIIEQNDQFGKCYQVNDPTSEENSDLLPSDGGVIKIQGLGKLVKMWPLGNSLIIFASNGIWELSGGTAGFAANDYTVRKVSNVRCHGYLSFVEAEGVVYFWNADGIYKVAPSQITQAYDAQSLTLATIKSFLDDISTDNKFYVKGAYDASNQILQWIYRSTDADTTAENYQYDRVLNLNLNTEAFYPWTISTADDLASSPFVSGIVTVFGGFGQSNSEETVINGSGAVVIQG